MTEVPTKEHPLHICREDFNHLPELYQMVGKVLVDEGYVVITETR